MKVLVLFSLLGVVATRASFSFCKRRPEVREEAADVIVWLETFLSLSLRHCPAAADAFFTPTCETTFYEGFCYASVLYETYGVDKKLSQCTYGGAEFFKVTTTYRDIAIALRPRGHLNKLGRLACQHGLFCFEDIVEQLALCSANDAHFYETALANAYEIIEPIIRENSGSFKEFLLCHLGEDSPIITLLELAEERITSLEDIYELLHTFVSLDMQNKLIVDIKSGVREFLGVFRNFCSADCVGESADFFRGLFYATHDEKKCPTIGNYCGWCQNFTDQYLIETAGTVPCCTLDALKNIVEAVHLMIDEYDDIIMDVEAAAKEAFVLKGEGIEIREYDVWRDKVPQTLRCLWESFEILDDGGCLVTV